MKGKNAVKKNKDADQDENCDDPFALIEQGNEFEIKEDWWEAAHSFLQASTILRAKSEYNNNNLLTSPSTSTSTSTPTSTPTHMNDGNANANVNTNTVKQRKVAALFADESVVYLHRARKSMISALNSEVDEDVQIASNLPTRVKVLSILLDGRENDGDGDSDSSGNVSSEMFQPRMETLESSQRLRRRELFQQLFISWKEEIRENNEGKTSIKNENENDQVNGEAKVLSLEERLAMLETTLPSQMKSDDQRMKDLQRSLSGLGVTVPVSVSSYHSTSDANGNGNSNLHSLLHENNDLSEEDQIDAIMNMAKDEVKLDNELSGSCNGNGKSEIHDVRELLKKSSIRIDLDPSYDDLDDDSNTDDDSSDYGNDPEMAFWKNLDIPREEKKAETKIEEMKQYLATAQQLLLQASLCLDELDEEDFAQLTITQTQTCAHQDVNKENGEITTIVSNDASIDTSNSKCTDADHDNCTNILLDEGTSAEDKTANLSENVTDMLIDERNTCSKEDEVAYNSNKGPNKDTLKHFMKLALKESLSGSDSDKAEEKNNTNNVIDDDDDANKNKEALNQEGTRDGKGPGEDKVQDFMKLLIQGSVSDSDSDEKEERDSAEPDTKVDHKDDGGNEKKTNNDGANVMGLAGLEEARELVEKVLSIWSPQK